MAAHEEQVEDQDRQTEAVVILLTVDVGVAAPLELRRGDDGPRGDREQDVALRADHAEQLLRIGGERIPVIELGDLIRRAGDLKDAALAARGDLPAESDRAVPGVDQWPGHGRGLTR